MLAELFESYNGMKKAGMAGVELPTTLAA